MSFWNQLGQDIDGEAANNSSGYSVSLSADGKIVAIGAIYNVGTASNSGHVRVYQYNSSNSTWSRLGQDIDGEAAGDQSGYSVSLSADGKIVAIGAIYNDGETGTNNGHVRVYQYTSSNSTWSRLGEDIDGEAASDNAGSSVSLSADGKIVAIGAPANDGETGTNSGHVRVFQYNSTDSVWVPLGQDIDGEAASDNAGSSVSLSADGMIVAIGSYYSAENGAYTGHATVYQYNKSTSLWNKLGQNMVGDAAGDTAGNSVSLSANGSILAIGARYNDSIGRSDAGQVQVYQYSSANNIWNQLGQDIDGEAVQDTAGWSVSLSADGTIVAIGIPQYWGTTKIGIVRMYRYNSSNSTWIQVGQNIIGEASTNYFGNSVSLSADGSIVAIGASNNDGANGIDSGHVRVYINTMNKYFYKNENIFNTSNYQGGFETNYLYQQIDIGSICNEKNFEPVGNTITSSGYLSNIKTYNTCRNWTASNLSGSYHNNILSVSISYTGQYAIACGYESASSFNDYVFYSSDYGVNWTRSNRSNVHAVSISNSGQYALAHQYNGKIYKSNDYGVTWTEAQQYFTPNSLRTIALSGNGQYAVAGEMSGNISTQDRNTCWYSLDYGNNWTKTTSNIVNIGTVAISNTGQYAIASGTTINGSSYKVFYSHDYGVTWSITESDISGTVSFLALAISGSGQYAISAVYERQIYYSKDYGVTWTASDSIDLNYNTGWYDKGWHWMSMSNSGQYALACVYNITPDSKSIIYYSNDYGVHWTESNSIQTKWGVTSISGNGKYAIASDNTSTGNIYYSTYNDLYFNFENGITYTNLDYTGNNRFFAAVSDDGKYVTTCNPSSRTLYLLKSSGSNWSSSTLSSRSSVPNVSRVAMSSTGQYIIAANVDTAFWGSTIYSQDYGKTWKMTNTYDGTFWSQGPLPVIGTYWEGLTMSDNGQYVIACSYRRDDYVYSSKTYMGALFFSNDYGATMTQFGQFKFNYNNYDLTIAANQTNTLTFETQKFWRSVCISGDGSRAIAVGGSGIWYLDRGTVFQEDQIWQQSTYDVSNVSLISSGMSRTGQYCIATAEHGYIYVSTNYGVSWVSKGINSYWYGSTISSTGQYMLASEYINSTNPGNIYFSNDYGTSFFALPRTDYWSTVTMSKNSLYAIAVGNNKIIYTSSMMHSSVKDLVDVLEPLYKYKTWTLKTTTTQLQLASISMSNDGKYIITGSTDANNNTLYISSDYGDNFTTKTINSPGETPIYWNSVSLSHNGNYILAAGFNIYYSTDNGVTFSFNGLTTNYGYQSVSISSGGKYAIACTLSNIYYSSNYGVTWTASTINNASYTIGTTTYTAPVTNWKSVSISSSGKYGVACVQGGLLYYSSNFGVTWNKSTRLVDGPTINFTRVDNGVNIDGAWRQWYSVSISGNGQYALACDYNSSIMYKSLNYGVDWVSVSSGKYYNSVSLSITGQYAIASANSNQLYYSNDYGDTWTAQTDTTNRIWNSVAISGNGQYAAACTNDGKVFVCKAVNY